MRIALIGAEIEENLGLRYIHSALVSEGHQTKIFDFHSETQAPSVVDEVLDWNPDLLGLSMVFTRRAREFVRLVRRLRLCGFQGHITSGGSFATIYAERLLADVPEIDSVVCGEGEEGLSDLLANMDNPSKVAGLTFRAKDGTICSVPPKAPPSDLDKRHWPTRPERLDSILTLPIAGMSAGRGCWANCRFCSIKAWHRIIGGKRFRQRSVESLADEMAWLYHKRGVRLFNFHDDNFFHPKREVNIRRLTDLKRSLKKRRVGRIGIQIKARPDSLDKLIVELLLDLGVFRVFVGIESGVERGLSALSRGVTLEQNNFSLKLLANAHVHRTFNLLIFEPECTLDDLRKNILFIRRHANLPLNFCRTEVYGGTPLEHDLGVQGRLIGNYFGYDYQLSNTDSELVYQIFRAVFPVRVFDLELGMNPRAMALDYHLHILKHFWPDRVHLSLERRVVSFIRELNEHSAYLLSRACDFVEKQPDTEEVSDFIRSLAKERLKFDQGLDRRSKVLLTEMRNLARMPRRIAEAGGARMTISLVLFVIAALIVSFLALFGDNIRAMFSVSAELAGNAPPLEPQEKYSEGETLDAGNTDTNNPQK